jgi:hypothetical protein
VVPASTVSEAFRRWLVLPGRFGESGGSWRQNNDNGNGRQSSKAVWPYRTSTGVPGTATLRSACLAASQRDHNGLFYRTTATDLWGLTAGKFDHSGNCRGRSVTFEKVYGHTGTCTSVREYRYYALSAFHRGLAIRSRPPATHLTSIWTKVTLTPGNTRSERDLRPVRAGGRLLIEVHFCFYCNRSKCKSARYCMVFYEEPLHLLVGTRVPIGTRVL